MDQFLLALCGLPASGKTSLSRALLQSLGHDTVSIVSTDEWRDAQYYRTFRPENELRVRRRASYRTRRLLKQARSVIHDDTNYYASMRHELFMFASSRKCRFGTLHVSTPLSVALRWNMKRSNSIPEDVIRRISERMDVPGERYAWDRPLARIDLSTVDIETAVALTVDALSSLEAAPRSSEQEHVSNMNAIDCRTREVVSGFLAAHPSHRDNPEVHILRKQAVRRSLEEGCSAEEAADRLKSALEDLTH